MEILKFRAWDKVNNEWIKTQSGGQSLNDITGVLEYTYEETFTLQSWETLRNIAAFPADYEIMQFTGLYDTEGNEIYKGDIVQDGDNDLNKKRVVIFENGAFYAPFIKKDSHIGYNKILLNNFFMKNGELYEHYKIEIIGNIHTTTSQAK